MRSKEVQEKRKTLGLTTKELSDALGYGLDGEKALRSWETGATDIPDEEYNRIMEFATIRPYAVRNPHPTFTFIDLFAGIGGIRMPFQLNGGECVFTCEWDAFAQKTYRINYGGEIAGDITKIDADDIPDHDICLAGFPCQPFSQAGLHKGFTDTRGTLFFEVERIMREKRPKAFLLENVKQLKGHDHGNTLRVILEHIIALGYSVDWRILAAKDFGLPQIRERIYLVGFDKNYYGIDNTFHFNFPTPPCSPTRVGDILDSDVDSKYTLSDRLWNGHQNRKRMNSEKGKGFGYSLFNADSPYTNTISARYYKDGSEALIEQVGNNPRKLTPRECARLQGYPEDFIIPVSDCRAYKQFGNSVAVPVIKAISDCMLSTMKELDKSRSNKQGSEGNNIKTG